MKNNKIEKAISRKVERILSKFDLEGKDSISKESLDEMVGHFQDSMNMIYNEYRLVKNQSQFSEKEIKNYMKELEEKNLQLSHQAKLAGIGEMAANISHEINTPLMIIASHLEKIRICTDKEKTNFKNEKLKKMIESSIVDGKKTVSQITKIVKSLKKISNDPDRVENENYSLLDVIRESSELFLEHFQTKDIKFDIVNNIGNPKIAMNVILMLQVFINLLQNALDAIEDLEDDDKWIRIELHLGDNSYKIRVTNGGPAIEEEHASNIFDLYYSTKDINKGTGLGLGICRKNLKPFGATLELEDLGSPSFLITIPNC